MFKRLTDVMSNLVSNTVNRWYTWRELEKRFFKDLSITDKPDMI